MRPRARLIKLIGDELISDEAVAVVELVKNSYDADAKDVTVSFDTSSGIAERLIIKDNGHGMTLDDVMHGWFEPGSIIKLKKDRSPGGRLYQGAKGVGRFAAARLGDSLVMETCHKKNNEYTTVIFDWGRFDNESYLDDIEIIYESKPFKVENPGTTLTIEGLKNRKFWEEDDFKILHSRLSRLISPFNDVKDFKIDLQIPLYPGLTGEVDPHELTRNPEYRFFGSLNKDGILNATVEVKGKLHKSYNAHKLSSEGQILLCGSFEFEIRAWNRDRDGLAPYMLRYDMNLTRIREILDTFCGVSIYRDGFRVHPYGEMGDDWLSLDTASRQTPTMNFANNQIIAAIKISRENNPELKDRSTREGLVHTIEYYSLKTWFKAVLHLLQEERYRLRPREDAKPEYVTTLFEAFDMTEVVKEADRQLGKKHPVVKLVKQKDVEIREGVKKLQEHYSRVLMSAGLGQLVDLVIHEIGAPLGRINRELNHVIKLMNDNKLDNEKLKINESFTSIKGWLEMIGNLRARLDPKTSGKRGVATSFTVEEEIIGNLNLYENLIAKQNIKVNFKHPKNQVVVHMSRSALGQIIANLIDNSVYWLTRHHGDGKGGRIDIRIFQIEKGFKIIYCDDGPGITTQDRERVFEQYFTTKPNGMGLGLYIARQIIEPYGKLIYKDDCDLSGAGFEVIFERKVGL